MISRSEIVAYTSNAKVVFRGALFTLAFSTDSTAAVSIRSEQREPRMLGCDINECVVWWSDNLIVSQAIVRAEAIPDVLSYRYDG